MPRNDVAKAKRSARVMRGVGVVRQQPRGNADDARDDIGFRVGERGAVRIEDVGVEE